MPSQHTPTIEAKLEYEDTKGCILWTFSPINLCIALLWHIAIVGGCCHNSRMAVASYRQHRKGHICSYKSAFVAANVHFCSDNFCSCKNGKPSCNGKSTEQQQNCLLFLHTVTNTCLCSCERANLELWRRRSFLQLQNLSQTCGLKVKSTLVASCFCSCKIMFALQMCTLQRQLNVCSCENRR